MRRLTEQEVRDWLKKNRPEIELVEYGGTTNKKSKFKCKKDGCGYEWTAPFSKIKDGHGCPKCGGTMRVEEKEIRGWINKNKLGVGLVEYVGSVNKKSLFYCKKCKKEFLSTITNIRRSFRRYNTSGCPTCGNRSNAEKHTITEEQVREWLKEHRQDIELIEYGGGVSVKSKYRCVECGNKWETVFSVIKSGCGCPKCAKKKAGEKQRITEEQVRNWLNDYRPHIKLIEYGGTTHKKSKFKCTKCGREWENTFSNIKWGSGCPDCICKYKKDGVTYDSRGEFVWHWCQELYGCVWHRNEQKENRGYYVLYRDENNKLRQFHPDFYIINPRFKKIRCYKDGVVCYVRIKMVEIKPDNGGLDRFHKMKRKVAKKYGIDFVGNDEIGNAEVVLYDNGITGCVIEQYRLNKEELEKCARDWLSENRPDIELIEYSGYTNRKSEFKCKKCGKILKKTFNTLKRQKYGCPKCARKKQRISEKQIREWLRYNNKNIKLIEYGGTTYKKSKFKCKKCGYEWCTTFCSIRQGHGCSKCADKRVAEELCITEEQVRKWLKNNKPNIVLVLYGGASTKKSKFRCKTCGKVFKKSFDAVKYSKYGCSECAKKKVGENGRVYNKGIINKWLLRNKKCVRVVDYCGVSHNKSTFYCEKCGNVFEKSFDVIKQRKHSCPNWRSHKQKELANGKA